MQCLTGSRQQASLSTTPWQAGHAQVRREQQGSCCQEAHALCSCTLHVTGMRQGSQQEAEPTAHSKRKPASTILLCHVIEAVPPSCSHLWDVDGNVALWIMRCLSSRLLLLCGETVVKLGLLCSNAVPWPRMQCAPRGQGAVCDCLIPCWLAAIAVTAVPLHTEALHPVEHSERLSCGAQVLRHGLTRVCPAPPAQQGPVVYAGSSKLCHPKDWHTVLPRGRGLRERTALLTCSMPRCMCFLWQGMTLTKSFALSAKDVHGAVRLRSASDGCQQLNSLLSSLEISN